MSQLKNEFIDEDVKKFRKLHNKKTPGQIIEDLERKKGIKFNIMNKEECKSRLINNTYYFKIGAYRHNFKKDKDNKYIDLEFAYLDDLAILDMRFREIVLSMSLGLEHSLKTLCNNIITQNRDEDGYEIVEDFIQDKNYDLDSTFNLYRKKSHYLYPIKEKYSDVTSIWVLLEIMTFGDLSKFIEFYEERATIQKKLFKLPSRLIRYAKNIRNAAAHNNLIILNLNKGKKISPDPKLLQVNEEIGLESNLYRNPKMNDILSLFFLYHLLCSKGMRKNNIKELEFFLKRCEKNKGFYSNNEHLSELYATLKKIIDYYKRKCYNVVE